EESRSLAFAGLLIDTGKRHPNHFAGLLRPLLRCHELYGLDLRAVVERAGGNAGFMAWGLQPAGPLRDQAQAWFAMPHRRRHLQELAVNLLLSDEGMRPFFAEARAARSE